jgi:hypothetical protein
VGSCDGIPDRAGNFRSGNVKQREGDQPLPTINDHPHIHQLVIADVLSRMELGNQRYGTPLQPFNGRDTLQDVYEELLDACCYIRQLMYERDAQSS